MTDKLKELALAANRICNIKAEPIKWFTQDELLSQTVDHTDDAAYIAAASPDAILALLKRAEDAEAEVERLKALFAQANGMTAAWKLTHDAVLASGAAPSTGLTLLAERDGLEIRAKKAEAEVERLTALEEATRKANLDCMDHYNEARADVERLTLEKKAAAMNYEALLNDALHQRNDYMRQTEELEAEVERLKAQPDKVAVLQAIARGWCSPKNSNKIMDCNLALAIQEEVMALLASGAAPKEPIQDVAMHVLTSIGGIDYDTAKSLVENAYGAAPKENT